MSNHYNAVAGLKPGKSGFDLSHTRLFDADIGRLIPVLCEECIPGDVFEISAINTIRCQPMVTPVYHRMEVFCHYFFVPCRLLHPDFEKFITGGAEGDDNTPLPKIFNAAITANLTQVSRYGLWDYFGFPMFDVATGVAEDVSTFSVQPPVSDFPWRAYWSVWRDFYRDSNHQLTYPNSVVECGEDHIEQMANLTAFMDDYNLGDVHECDIVPYRCWSKDYATSALSDQQRGTAPSIPISGTSSAVWDTANFEPTTGGGAVNVASGGADPRLRFIDQTQADNARAVFDANTVDHLALGVDISDLRLAVQTQKWMERNSRGGYRYDEFLRAHFGVIPKDARLQKAEYIGGSRQPVIISEVIQSSETNVTAQGTMVGHGMTVSQNFVGRYRVQEHGIIIGIMSIMPEAIYQQGIPRMWSKETRFDYYTPEYAHLSEQEIKQQELFYSRNVGIDETRFGFQAAFDEYRTRSSVVCGKLASTLDYWHLSRQFDSVPALNEEFLTLEEHSVNRRDAWAVPGVENNEQGQFLVQWRNIIKAVRCMPYISDPGLLDHF